MPWNVFTIYSGSRSLQKNLKTQIYGRKWLLRLCCRCNDGCSALLQAPRHKVQKSRDA